MFNSNGFQKNPLPYFKVPLAKPELGIVYNGKWMLDKTFVEQRLAGLNPMALQKVTPTGINIVSIL